MSEMDNNNMEEDVVVFEDEDGTEFQFTVLDYFFYNGEEYALLEEITDENSEDEEGGCIVCRIESAEDENGEETEEFVPVEDEDMAEKLFEIATTKLMNDEKEEE